jgi:hypothetical protein
LAGEQAATLLHLDARLLELEMKEKAGALARSGAWGLAAIALAGMGTFVVVLGLVGVLVALGMALFVAAFVVGAVLFAVGALFALRARSVLVGWSVVPRRTVEQVRQDAAAIREGFRNGIR